MHFERLNLGKENYLREFGGLFEREIMKFEDPLTLETISHEILEKIDPRSIDQILNIVVSTLQQERQKRNEERFKSLNLEEAIDELFKTSSASHAILCAVNGREDFKKVFNIFERFIREKKIEENDGRILYIREVINRNIKIYDIEIELLKIDAKRRIGELKKDNSFFEQSLPQLESLIPVISEFLNYYKENDILSKPEEVKNLIEEIERYLELIENKNYDLIREKFYDFCLNLSTLRNIYFEELEVKQIRENVKDLVKF